MNSRERFFAAISHKQPDRVPYYMFMCEKLEKEMQAAVPGGADYRDYFDEDIRFCEFGITESVWQKIRFENMPLPSEAQIAAAATECQKYKDAGRVTCSAYIPGVYETLKQIIGDENALLYIYEEPDKLKEMIAAITDWRCKIAEIHARAGVDICFIGDDIGAQNSLIMSMDSYREFYKPSHIRLVQTAKNINPDIKMAFHCCGHVMPLVPELIDIGVDILQAVQPEAANDLAELKRKYGKDVTFWGGIGMQSVFAAHPPEYVIENTCRTLAVMAAGGGYISSPCHKATEDISLENVLAFYQAMKLFGSYKL